MADIYADSASQADVQDAIDSASDYDNVFVPIGNSTWTGTATIVNKSINLIGAGIDSTVITSTGGGQTFQVTTYDGKKTRISGFTIDGDNTSNGIYLWGDSKNWRIDHNKFKNCPNTAIINIPQHTYGLIDNNIFIDNTQFDVRIVGDDNARNRSIELGTANAIYVEDNEFYHSVYNAHAITGIYGARFVARYNTFDDTYTGGNGTDTPIDAHGYCYWGRGTVSYEIYNNYISSDRSAYAIDVRGGTGVVYDNDLVGTFLYATIHLVNYRSHDATCPECEGLCADAEGYPCIDQINELYIWDNTLDESPTSPSVHSAGSNPDHIQEDRDFYEEELIYTPYTYPHPLQEIAENTFIAFTV